MADKIELRQKAQPFGGDLGVAEGGPQGPPKSRQTFWGESRVGQGIAKGLALTLKHLVSRAPITVQYPEQRLANSRRLRGCDLVWDPERCTACCSCQKSCPQGNIRIETRLRPDNTREAVAFEIDHGRTMFCGLCVEACPFDAIHMGVNYERATYSRASLVLDKEALTISKERRPSGYYRPQFEATLPPQTLLVYGGKAAEAGPESKEAGKEAPKEMAGTGVK